MDKFCNLEIIAGSIEQSVAAWEKRNYWVKADKYRLQWEWVDPALDALLPYLENGGGAENIPVETLAEIAQELGGITISPNHRMGMPWTGAYAIWQLQQSR